MEASGQKRFSLSAARQMPETLDNDIPLVSMHTFGLWEVFRMDLPAQPATE